MQNNTTRARADIGVLGMAVMGKNLALNMADEGFRVSIYNRTTEKAEAAARENPEQQLIVCKTLEAFVLSLKRPRRIFLMIKAGPAVDAVISDLLPLLDPGDLIMDGGNSYFRDSQRRHDALKAKGFEFMGVGVSGGETGARFGPAIMPGGSADAYELAAPVLEAVAAKAEDGTPCCALMGEGGAGHYVKMVHNGIEYADMEIIAELYALLKSRGETNAEIAERFAAWNKGPLSSYLSEITVRILKEKDPEDPEGDLLPGLLEEPLADEIRGAGAEKDSPCLLDHILDISRQKGTGKWTNEEGLNLGTDLSVLTAGLNARYISEDKGLRVKASELLPAGIPDEEAAPLSDEELADAFLLARTIAYAQGFALYRAASREYGWGLDYKAIAATFREGCIIRSALLTPIMEAYARDPELENLLLTENFAEVLTRGIKPLRRLVSAAALSGQPVPAFAAALSYYDQLRTKRSSAAMIQAQRDYFGAHTFQRTDAEGIYHHEWPQEEEA